MDDVSARLAELAPPEADPYEVAKAIVSVVSVPRGSRPFRVTVDPANDGSNEVSDVADRVRERFYERVRLTDLLTVKAAEDRT